MLCSDFIEIIKTQLNIPIYGQITQFSTLFELLLNHSKQEPFILIIDEFQEFETINSSILSEIQRLWDLNKDEAKLHLVVCGSVFSIMTRIFQDAKQPLFGRATQRLNLKAFSPNVVKSILETHNPGFKPIDLIAFYAISGGIPKYVELLEQNNAFTLESITKEIFKPYSLWIDEGKWLLMDEFGKEYATYFSILSLLSDSKTSRSEIESILGQSVGGHLERLDSQYNLIKPVRPLFAKPQSRTMKYAIEDPFLRFWFRFIYKHQQYIEAGNLDYVRSLFERDFRTFAGKTLEQWFLLDFKQTGLVTDIGTWWDKKGHEIDIIALDKTQKKATLFEIKFDKSRYRESKLIESMECVKDELKDYEIALKCLGLDDM